MSLLRTIYDRVAKAIPGGANRRRDKNAEPPGHFTLGSTYLGGPLFTDAFGAKRAPSPWELIEKYKSLIYALVTKNANSRIRVPLRLYADSSRGAKPRSLCDPIPVTARSMRRHLSGLEHTRVSPSSVDQVYEVRNHPVLDALDAPDPYGYFDRAKLLSLISRYNDIVGQHFMMPEGNGWREPGARTKGPPVYFWALYSQYVLPIRATGSPLIDHFQYFAESIPFDQLVWFRLNHSLRDPYGAGYSPAYAGTEYANLEDRFVAIQEQLLGIGPRPNLIATAIDPQNPPGEKERLRLEQELRQKHAGGYAGGVLVNTGAWTFTPTSFTPSDLGGLQISEYDLNRLCNIFGVPPSYMSTETNLANLQAADTQHARDAVEPWCCSVASTLTRIVREFDSRLFFAFDPCVPEDEERNARIMDMQLEKGLITINQANEESQWPKAKHGDEPWLSSTLAQPSMLREKHEQGLKQQESSMQNEAAMVKAASKGGKNGKSGGSGGSAARSLDGDDDRPSDPDDPQGLNGEAQPLEIGRTGNPYHDQAGRFTSAGGGGGKRAKKGHKKHRKPKKVKGHLTTKEIVQSDTRLPDGVKTGAYAEKAISKYRRDYAAAILEARADHVRDVRKLDAQYKRYHAQQSAKEAKIASRVKAKGGDDGDVENAIEKLTTSHESIAEEHKDSRSRFHRIHNGEIFDMRQEWRSDFHEMLGDLQNRGHLKGYNRRAWGPSLGQTRRLDSILDHIEEDLERYNPYRDPATGRYTSGPGGGGSGLVGSSEKPRKDIVKLQDEAKPKVSRKPEVKKNPKDKANAQIKTQVKVHPKPKGERKPKVESSPKAQHNPNVEAKPKAKHNPNGNPKSKAEATYHPSQGAIHEHLPIGERLAKATHLQAKVDALAGLHDEHERLRESRQVYSKQMNDLYNQASSGAIKHSEADKLVRPLIKEDEKLAAQQLLVKAKIQEAAHGLVTLPEDAPGVKWGYRGVENFSSELRAQHDQARAWIESRLADGSERGYMGRANLEWKEHPGDGPFRASATRTTITVARGDQAHTIIHEWGHQLEHHVDGVEEAAREFLEHRVDGEPFKPLSVFSNQFRLGEMGRDDKFLSAMGSLASARYAGKIYRDGGTEIVSMGLEKFYQNPAGFAKADPEYCKFILGILDSSMRKPGRRS